MFSPCHQSQPSEKAFVDANFHPAELGSQDVTSKPAAIRFDLACGISGCFVLYVLVMLSFAIARSDECARGALSPLPVQFQLGFSKWTGQQLLRVLHDHFRPGHLGRGLESKEREETIYLLKKEKLSKCGPEQQAPPATPQVLDAAGDQSRKHTTCTLHHVVV